MNCKGDDDVDAKRSRPSIGKPVLGHARKERVLLIGTDQRITSGPAARTAAFRGRIHDCTRIVSRKGRSLSLATRAPSIHVLQGVMTTLMRKGRDSRSKKPFCVTRGKSA